MKITPFCDIDAQKSFRLILEEIEHEIMGQSDDYFLSVNLDEAKEYYINKALINPLKWFPDEKYIEKETRTSKEFPRGYRMGTYQQSGIKLDIAVPYEGSKQLWKYQPSNRILTAYPTIYVSNKTVSFSVFIQDGNENTENIESEINSSINLISKCIENLNRTITNHNNEIEKIVCNAIEKKVEISKKSKSVVSKLGIPLKKRDKPLSYTIETRKKISIKRPQIKKAEYSPEPTLGDKEYNDILDIMRGMSTVIEQNPSAFKEMKEETIRSHFLVQLNGHYEGMATGETFNASGRTDIIIKEENKNVFIAEFKFWKGSSEFNKAIDQLLSYLSWRDSKCALLIFNKNTNTTDVANKMKETMQAREEFKRIVSESINRDVRYIFLKKSDPEKEIIITTQIYDLS